jgi:phage baseplate assembly protein gpV
MIQYGQIKDFRYRDLGDGKVLEAKVLVDGRLTNWLPVKTQSSSFLKEHIPVSSGDQVIVFNPFGNNEDGFIDRNISYEKLVLPKDIDENIYYQEFRDGTKYTHDILKKTITLDTSLNINITTSKDVKLKATNVVVDSQSIDLGKGGKGVITAECICKLDGLPHSDFSAKVRATK